MEEEPADEESADSEATVLYTPPEIPDATDNPTPKKGKLRIKKTQSQEIRTSEKNKDV